MEGRRIDGIPIKYSSFYGVGEFKKGLPTPISEGPGKLQRALDYQRKRYRLHAWGEQQVTKTEYEEFLRELDAEFVRQGGFKGGSDEE